MDKIPVGQDLKVQVTDRQIFSIALPITLSILVPQINILVNSIFLGRLSAEALGNAGVTAVFYLIFAIAGNGFNNSMQTIFARYAGKDKPEAFSNVLWHGLGIALLFSLCAMLLTWSSVTPLLHLFSSSDQIPEEASFLRIRICGLPFLFVFQVCNAFLIASLNSRLLILGAISQALINIFFDYALIFGHFGMPAMGFIGAAWASVISEGGAALVVICVLVFSGLGKTYRLFIPVRWDVKMAKVISSLSAPLILQYVISVGFWLVFFLFIEEKGTHAKAISNTMRSVMGLAGIFCWSLCGSVNVMVSNLIGQGRPQDVMPVTTRIALWSGGICCFLLILLNISPRGFFALFSPDEIFIREGISVLRVVSAGMVMMAVANIWLNAITGTGKTKVNLLIEITAVILYMLYTLFVLKWNYVSLAVAWSNELFYWTFILIFSFLYMKGGKWKGAETIATD